jgi:hypothetical protein
MPLLVMRPSAIGLASSSEEADPPFANVERVVLNALLLGAACRLFWRKRSDDLIKARIAAQRVPKRIET